MRISRNRPSPGASADALLEYKGGTNCGKDKGAGWDPRIVSAIPCADKAGLKLLLNRFKEE
jgi:hypothetical protein